MAGNAGKQQAGSKKKRTRKSKAKAANASKPAEKVLARKRAGAPKYEGLRMTGPDGRYISESDFIKLTLDPCHGPLTASPFGKTENSYIWRLNYRSTIVSNSAGHMMAVLNPLGVYNAFGSSSANLPQNIQIWSTTGLSDSAISVGSNGTAAMPGIQALEGVAAQVRVTAGCITLSYVGSAQNAQGQLYAWEGQGDEVFASVAAAQNMTCKQTPTGFAMNGMTAPITAGVEAMLNYSKVATEDQWKFGDIQVGRADVFTPFAVVGVSGGPSTANYIVEATLVVEWTPLLSQGVPAPVAAVVKPGSAERVANALRLVAPLLVKTSSVALGGYAPLVGKVARFGAQVYQALRA